MRIQRWLAWVGWYVAAGFVVTVWTVLASVPYGIVNSAVQFALAGRGAPAFLAWLMLPLLVGVWPYLLLRLTARQVGLNGGVFWVYVVSAAAAVYSVIAAALGMDNDLRAYRLFGFDPTTQGLGVWAAWTLLAACSIAGALIVYRVHQDRARREPDAHPGHG